MPLDPCFLLKIKLFSMKRIQLYLLGLKSLENVKSISILGKFAKLYPREKLIPLVTKNTEKQGFKKNLVKKNIPVYYNVCFSAF